MKFKLKTNEKIVIDLFRLNGVLIVKSLIFLRFWAIKLNIFELFDHKIWKKTLFSPRFLLKFFFISLNVFYWVEVFEGTIYLGLEQVFWKKNDNLSYSRAIKIAKINFQSVKLKAEKYNYFPNSRIGFANSSSSSFIRVNHSSFFKTTAF